MYHRSVDMGDQVYTTSEHAYQILVLEASRKIPSAQLNPLWLEEDPFIVKKEAKKLKIKYKLNRVIADSVKLNIMYNVVRAKFTQYTDLRYKLLDTAPAILAEANNDFFWGIGFREHHPFAKKPEHWGSNHLGRILMDIRYELLKEEPVAGPYFLKQFFSKPEETAPEDRKSYSEAVESKVPALDSMEEFPALPSAAPSSTSVDESTRYASAVATPRSVTRPPPSKPARLHLSTAGIQRRQASDVPVAAASFIGGQIASSRMDHKLADHSNLQATVTLAPEPSNLVAASAQFSVPQEEDWTSEDTGQSFVLFHDSTFCPGSTGTTEKINELPPMESGGEESDDDQEFTLDDALTEAKRNQNTRPTLSKAVASERNRQHILKIKAKRLKMLQENDSKEPNTTSPLSSNDSKELNSKPKEIPWLRGRSKVNTSAISPIVDTSQTVDPPSDVSSSGVPPWILNRKSAVSKPPSNLLSKISSESQAPESPQEQESLKSDTPLDFISDLEPTTSAGHSCQTFMKLPEPQNLDLIFAENLSPEAEQFCTSRFCPGYPEPLPYQAVSASSNQSEQLSSNSLSDPTTTSDLILEPNSNTLAESIDTSEAVHLRPLTESLENDTFVDPVDTSETSPLEPLAEPIEVTPSDPISSSGPSNPNWRCNSRGQFYKAKSGHRTYLISNCPICKIPCDDLRGHAKKHLPWFTQPELCCWQCDLDPSCRMSFGELQRHFRQVHPRGRFGPQHAAKLALLKLGALHFLKKYFRCDTLSDLLALVRHRDLEISPLYNNKLKENCTENLVRATICSLFGIPCKGFQFHPISHCLALLHYRLLLKLLSFLDPEARQIFKNLTSLKTYDGRDIKNFPTLPDW